MRYYIKEIKKSEKAARGAAEKVIPINPKPSGMLNGRAIAAEKKVGTNADFLNNNSN